MWIALAVSVGCARGGDGSTDAGGATVDAGGGMDAGAPSEDAGPSEDDAGAGDDAGPMVDPDAGGGPIACTPETAATVCGGLPCVDGYCCDQPCDGACRGCASPGAEGTCTQYASGSDPDDECADEAPGTCGTTGACDGAGACALHPTTVTCDDGMACTTGDACDGAGTCRGDAPADCAPAAGNECCIGSCDTAGGCVTEAGTCGDTCGGNTLQVGDTCQGCGAARAAGSCLGGTTHVCDASSHSLCQQVSCGGTTYFCTQSGGTWAWRASSGCDDGDACTFGDACGSGTCGGTPVTCASTDCMIRSCNGTATCTETPRTGMSCDDGDACTHGDSCSSAGVCVPAGSVTCASTACLDRACNGTASCTETPRTGLSCDDSDPCTFGEVCGAGGACGGGTPVTCPADETCRTWACDGTASCASTPRNVGMTCDDGDPGTPVDRCAADGTCEGLTCTPTLTTVFSETFGSGGSSSWTSGTDAAVASTPWRAWTTAQHGVRVDSGRLEITNRRSGSPGHGHGYAVVRTDGAGSVYDNTSFSSTLSSNAGHDVVWSFNMRRDDPESTDGGFSCSSTSSQNDRTVGLAYVLGTDAAAGLNSSTSTCSASATGVGYAVVFGGASGRVRLVRFEDGLRNGALTTIAQSSSFSRSNHLSVRVTFNADTNGWRLEARSDGSSFSDPASGSYSSSTTGTDATHVGAALDYSGPYFQTGCCCLCSSTYTTRFDNVTVGVRCAGG